MCFLFFLRDFDTEDDPEVTEEVIEGSVLDLVNDFLVINSSTLTKPPFGLICLGDFDLCFRLVVGARFEREAGDFAEDRFGEVTDRESDPGDTMLATEDTKSFFDMAPGLFFDLCRLLLDLLDDRFGEVSDRVSGGESILSTARSFVERLVIAFDVCLCFLVLDPGVPEDESFGLIIERYSDAGDFAPAPPFSGEALAFLNFLDFNCEGEEVADDDKIGSVCDLGKDFGVSSIPSTTLPSTGMDVFEVADGDEQDTRSGAAPIERVDET